MTQTAEQVDESYPASYIVPVPAQSASALAGDLHLIANYVADTLEFVVLVTKDEVSEEFQDAFVRVSDLIGDLVRYAAEEGYDSTEALVAFADNQAETRDALTGASCV
jgi:uncharacterized protein Yka (UPF0111/DUF47 family)